MRILLTGGTGLIGRALCQHWSQQGHALYVWSRSPQQVPALCGGARGIAQLQELDGGPPLDAVVNLAGAPIADRPWTQARQALLWRSRVDLTRSLVDWIGRQPVPPRVLLSGSAVGWYGDGGQQWLSEDSAPGNTDFGSRLCVAWEQEAERARQWGVWHVFPRQGRATTSIGLGARNGRHHGAYWIVFRHPETVGTVNRHIDSLLAVAPYVSGRQYAFDEEKQMIATAAETPGVTNWRSVASTEVAATAIHSKRLPMRHADCLTLTQSDFQPTSGAVP